MAAMVRGRGPKDTKKTVGRLMRYLGRHKLALIAVAVMVFIGSGANIFGTYLLKPVINRFVLTGDVGGLAVMLLMMGLMYLAGAAATWGYMDGRNVKEYPLEHLRDAIAMVLQRGTPSHSGRPRTLRRR